MIADYELPEDRGCILIIFLSQHEDQGLACSWEINKCSSNRRAGTELR